MSIFDHNIAASQLPDERIHDWFKTQICKWFDNPSLTTVIKNHDADAIASLIGHRLAGLWWVRHVEDLKKLGVTDACTTCTTARVSKKNIFKVIIDYRTGNSDPFEENYNGRVVVTGLKLRENESL